jgi:Ca2+-binding RTX toxin-like protein
VGYELISVAVGDFNGDRRPDLATANIGNNNVSVLLGTGNGSFSPATNFGVGSRPISVAVGDFNADGRPDLTVANTVSNNVSVLLNTTTSNNPPVAGNDTVTANQNTALTIPVATLLANDSDPDGNPLSITAVSNAVNGTISLNDNGTAANGADDFVVFTPTSGFSGDASFNYTLSDGQGATASGTVTVAVGINLDGGNNNDNLQGTPGNDILTGNNAQDTLSGGAGNDSLTGGNGDDQLFGGDGRDTLLGGNGQDRLFGGKGDDILTGNNGSDTFVLASNSGTDTITDFSFGNDRIGLSNGLTFADLSFAGNEILVGGQTLAILTGFDTTTLTQGNFVAV